MSDDMTPRARQDGLVVQELGEEVVIYDQQRHRVHRLNRAAALIWRHCDGQATVSELAGILQGELSAPVTENGLAEDLIRLALDRLDKAHLLQDPPAWPEAAERITRRQALRKAALVGGLTLLLPVVQSIAAPTPAMALSVPCAGIGQPPMGRPCCPGLRVIGGRCYGRGRGLP